MAHVGSSSSLCIHTNLTLAPKSSLILFFFRYSAILKSRFILGIFQWTNYIWVWLAIFNDALLAKPDHYLNGRIDVGMLLNWDEVISMLIKFQFLFLLFLFKYTQFAEILSNAISIKRMNWKFSKPKNQHDWISNTLLMRTKKLISHAIEHNWICRMFGAHSIRDVCVVWPNRLDLPELKNNK